MGAVFLARDLKLDRLVAIKVLPPELAVRPELRERFLRETRTATSFSHPNIVSVHGTFQVKRTGLLMAASSVILIAVATIQVLTDPAREPLTDWLNRLFFGGRAGRWCLRAVGWRLGAQRDVPFGSVPSRHGALTLLDTLQGDDRKRLGKMKVALERLEGEIQRLERREKELEAATVDARVNAPTLPGSTSGRQQTLFEDLERARRTAMERRIAILTALRNIRLSLVRVKSRIGTTDDAERDVLDALRLVDAPTT